jgi:hypothetical protein
MRHRPLVVTVLTGAVFVGVLLLMVSAGSVGRGLPVAAVCALAAAVVSWRWAGRVE